MRYLICQQLNTSVSCGVSFLPLHTPVSQSSAACSVVFPHYILRWHKVPQMRCLFCSLHTSVSQSTAACGDYISHFTLQYHKVPEHVCVSIQHSLHEAVLDTARPRRGNDCQLAAKSRLSRVCALAVACRAASTARARCIWTRRATRWRREQGLARAARPRSTAARARRQRAEP